MRFNAHVFQHVSFEGPGSIRGWLERRNAVIRTTRLFEGGELPRLDEVDFLIVMGGPMSVNAEKDYPWLRAEKAFIREAIDAGIPVLGICLGAQLIATCLGASVYPAPHKEIGWFPVRAVKPAHSGFDFPESVPAFHWHGEMFDLPPGAVHLAESDACSHQAFQIGDRVIGLQFHLETTPESACALITNCRNELVPGPYVQSEEDLRAVDNTRTVEVNEVMDRVLEYLTRGRFNPT